MFKKVVNYKNEVLAMLDTLKKFLGHRKSFDRVANAQSQLKSTEKQGYCIQYRAKVYEHFRFSVDFGRFRLTLSLRHTVKIFAMALKIFGHIKHNSNFIFVVDNFFVPPPSRQIELVQIYYLRNSPFSVVNLEIFGVLH